SLPSHNRSERVLAAGYRGRERSVGRMETKLCPAQERALAGLLRGLQVGQGLVLQGEAGMGKTGLLRELHRAEGGAFLTIQQFVDAMRGQHPLAMEETFGQMVMAALQAHDLVIVDDLDLVTNVVGSCRSYPRAGFLDAPLAVLTSYAVEARKKLIF